MKEKKKKVTLYITLGIIAIGIIALTVTYAYWRLTKEQTKKDVLQTGCFNINFTGENDITLNKAYPMKPDELENFLSTETPYHFTIENTCDNLATATINLESLNAGAEKQLNDEYIDAILYETDYHNNLNSEKKLNESMYNDENKVISNSLHAYQLYNFTLQKGETKSFNLLLYMEPNTPMETANMNATWKGKITLSAGYKEEKASISTIELGKDIQPVENGDGLYAVSHDVSEISTDWNQTEYRYAGINPNNYLSFNNEIWRVIGLVNVKVGESIEQRLKIVRTNGIGNQKDFGFYVWDKDTEYTNNWTTSKLKDMLNGTYYESSTGDCYKGATSNSSPLKTICDFNSEIELPKGLDVASQNMIDKDIIWSMGGDSNSTVTTYQYYEKERGNNAIDSNQLEWSSTTDEKYNGIGLIYPSDYGYASNGGNLGREKCLNKSLSSWDDDYNENYKSECGGKDWIKPNDGSIWTLMPSSSSNEKSYYVNYTGIVSSTYIDVTFGVVPTLYLKSTVKITTNPHSEQEYGTIDNPFQLVDTSL